MTLSTEILDYLEAQGVVGGSTGWGRAAGSLPPTPDKVLVVYETPGLEPELAPDGSPEQEYDEPSFQLRGRGEAFGGEELEQKMREAYLALHGADPTGYLLIRAEQSATMNVGRDSNDRPGRTMNFAVIRERS